MDLPALNEYLKSVIDLIPAHSYFAQHQPADQNNKNKKNRKKKGEKVGNQNVKNGVKMTPRKRKMEPAFMKTTSEQIADCDDDDENTESVQKHAKRADHSDSPTLTALQKRLREKLAEIQAQRNPKNRSPQEIEKIRDRRKRERAKYKTKKKLKNEKLSNSASVEMQGKPGQKMMKSERSAVSKPETAEGKAVFSKFDFGKEIEAKKKKKEAKTKTRTLLAQAEIKKQKLEDLKSTNPEEADSKIKRDSWGKALAKAGGTKVKDDPELLKKSLKKEKSIKRQHAKKWKEREQNVKEKMQQRQEKRARNIQARKDQMKDKKKVKRAKKFAKSSPGF